MWTDWLQTRRGLLRIASVVVPLVISGLLHLGRDLIGSAAAALILVLAVVAASATGDRVSGILACVASAVGFDFFLTVPYLDLHITDSQDLELAVLLLLVGLAVNELALWGGRQRAAASQRAGFISGVLESAEQASEGVSPDQLRTTIAGHIKHTLGAERVEYHPGPPDAEAAVLDRDGAASYQGLALDIARDGLPPDRYTAVPVIRDGTPIGHFEVTAATRLVRPTAEQLRVAILLASQLATRSSAPRPH